MTEGAIILMPLIWSCIDTDMLNTILIRVKIAIFYNCILDIKDIFE